MVGLTPISFLVAKNAALISIQAYPPASDVSPLQKYQRAVVDSLASQKGSYSACVSPGMYEGTVEISLTRGESGRQMACGIDSRMPVDAIRDRLSLLVATL